MNKKNGIILAIVIIVLLIVGGLFFYFRSTTSGPSDNENNYEANRTSIDGTNTTNDEQQQVAKENSSSTEITQGITEPEPPVEEQIATFTTKIYSSDSARQNNISITCNTLNGTVVKNGATFSFCNTVRTSI